MNPVLTCDKVYPLTSLAEHTKFRTNSVVIGVWGLLRMLKDRSKIAK